MSEDNNNWIKEVLIAGISLQLIFLISLMIATKFENISGTIFTVIFMSVSPIIMVTWKPNTIPILIGLISAIIAVKYVKRKIFRRILVVFLVIGWYVFGFVAGVVIYG